MFLRNLFVVLSVSLLVSPAFGADLTRDTTYSTSDAYVWLFEAGSDIGSDQATGNTNAVAVVVDDNSEFVRSEVNGLATPATSSSTVARVDGDTMTTSSWSGGSTDGNNDWHMGTLQTFAGSVETNNTVSVAGTLNHYVSFSFISGHEFAEGDMNARATVGNVQVYFSWSGWKTLNVKEYVDGVLDQNINLVSTTGQFTYVQTYSQEVQVGDTVEVDAYGAVIDFDNWGNVTKSLTVLAGSD